MTTPFGPPMPEPEPDPAAPHPTARPGRKLGPVSDTVGSTHNSLLAPMRAAYFTSGLTLNDLSARVRLSKSKLSELLRGAGLYPRWENILSLAVELGVPQWPLYRLWRQAAIEAHKSREWIERSSQGATTALTTSHTPPLEHRAFRETNEGDYRLYAQVFLNDEQRDSAVSDTFDILWLRWNNALASPDVRRYAWTVLRTTVMSRTPHLDGRPEFAAAAFDSVALQQLTETSARMSQIAESLELFTAMSRLPDRQLDVMVLRRLCGFTPEAASALLGVPLATVRSDERHAIHFLESVICPPPPTGRNGA